MLCTFPKIFLKSLQNSKNFPLGFLRIKPFLINLFKRHLLFKHLDCFLVIFLSFNLKLIVLNVLVEYLLSGWPAKMGKRAQLRSFSGQFLLCSLNLSINLFKYQVRLFLPVPYKPALQNFKFFISHFVSSQLFERFFIYAL